MAKHVPNRMCIACRAMKPRTELIRLVMTDRGLTVDDCGKAQGRGAYICRSAACVELALKAHRLEQQFKAPLDEKTAACLRAQAEAAECAAPDQAGAEAPGSSGSTVVVPGIGGQTVRVIRRGRRGLS